MAHGEFPIHCLIPTAMKSSNAQDLESLNCFRQVCILRECQDKGYRLEDSLWLFYSKVEYSQKGGGALGHDLSQVYCRPCAQEQLGFMCSRAGSGTCIPRCTGAPLRHQGWWEQGASMSWRVWTNKHNAALTKCDFYVGTFL